MDDANSAMGRSHKSVGDSVSRKNYGNKKAHGLVKNKTTCHRPIGLVKNLNNKSCYLFSFYN